MYLEGRTRTILHRILPSVLQKKLKRSHSVHRTNVAYCDMPDFPWSVCLCVLGTPVNRAKTEGPIDMPFGQQTCEGPGNHV